MRVSNLCMVRQIGGTSRLTPLLLPSYSSRGFKVKAIHEDTKNFVADAKLVSAFDIKTGAITKGSLYASDLLFIDSGHYERYPMVNPGEPYEDYSQGSSWTIDDYRDVFRGVETNRCEVVRVSYDEYTSLREQIEGAQASKTEFSNMALDFLIKPDKKGELLDVRALNRNARNLAFADVIGFTEKELGDSYIERVKAIMLLRSGITRAGLKTPIHVFGCLDPFGAVAYHAAGADIFDGLSWLRFAWTSGTLTYIPNATALAKKWNTALQVSTRETQVSNLNQLRLLQRSLRKLAKSGSLSDIEPPWSAYAEEVKALLGDCDIQDGGA